MIRESQIVHENGPAWILKGPRSYTVYLAGVTHSVSDSAFPLDDDGLSIAKCRADYLAKHAAIRAGATTEEALMRAALLREVQSC